jgi:hypothetical protein
MYRVFVVTMFLIAVWTSPALPQAGQPAATPPQEDPSPVLAVPKDYKYDARGRRDPFVNPVPKPVAGGTPIPVVRPPGLKGVLMAEASIAGVVTSRVPSMNVVIINAPPGKTYFARVGDALFDASVKEIRLETVTFALNSAPPTGPRDVVRKVRPAPGE